MTLLLLDRAEAKEKLMIVRMIFIPMRNPTIMLNPTIIMKTNIKMISIAWMRRVPMKSQMVPYLNKSRVVKFNKIT